MPQFSTQERARIPIRYMSRLFAAGNDAVVAEVYRKLFAVRVHMRAKKVGDVPEEKLREALALGQTTATEAEAIFRLTALPTPEERYVIPPMTREVAVQELVDPYTRRAEAGFGFTQPPERRW
jgi:nitrate reductase beta subunit